MAIAHGTRTRESNARSSLAPGSGRTSAALRAYASACSACKRAISSPLSGRPVSRDNAATSRPPLMPMRLWMRHTATSMPSASSASRQPSTCW